MKNIKKSFNIFMIALILVINFLPVLTLKVNAEEGTNTNAIDMSLWYKLYIYYPDDRVPIGSYGSYEEAKSVMNTIKSTSNKNATILAGDQIIDSAYAIVHMDQPAGSGRVSANDHVLNVYASAEDAYFAHRGVSRSAITYVAGTWGVDAAFLDYNPGYGVYKIKISGVTGWIDISEVTIVPIATYSSATSLYPNNSAKIKVTLRDNIIVRKGPGTNYDQQCSNCVAKYNTTYEYYPSKTVTNGGYTWYYIKYDSSNKGYIASQNVNWVTELNTLLTDTFYYSNNNILYHHVHKGLRYSDVNLSLGTAPFYYSNQSTKTYYFTPNNIAVSIYTPGSSIQNRYLSFDGNYFYNDYADMIDDYRNETSVKALNKDNPHYPYFMYLPSHSQSKMTAENINNAIRIAGKTSGLTHEPSYYYNSNGAAINNIGTESNLYGMGDDIIAIADKFCVNPLAIYTSAYRESAIGTSAIAVLKNNLFGYGASDSNPLGNARTYPRVQDSIYEYAQVIGGNSNYTNISSSLYNGTHKGNKQSGTIVKYMSDPYGGESDTSTTYSIDSMSGGIENYSNTIGIKNSNNVISILAEPSSQSRIIYTTVNGATGRTLTNLPFIVIDKVSTYENGKYQGFYKVYTDLTLNSDRVVDSSVYYDFKNCYGYIKEEDLYVQNHQPVITASNIEMKQFENIDLMKNVTANDYEDGNLTSKIKVSGTYDTNVVGNYTINYTVTDENNFSVNKAVTLTINPTSAPIIETQLIEVPQYTVFDPLKGVTVTDTHDGNITSKIKVKSNQVNTNILGEYKVVYQATNSSNITSEKTRVVQVVVNKKPTITANNTTLYLDDAFDALKNVTANDYEDGNITSKITVSGNVDTSKVGEYPITYSVKDSIDQTVTKNIVVTVEERAYTPKDSIFYLDQLLYSKDTKKVSFRGFLIIKGMDNTLDKNIKYSIIFENQTTGNTIIKNLTRMTSNFPFAAPNSDGYTNTGAWFNEDVDLSDIPTGDYTVYVRARLDNYESKILLKNPFFNEKVSSKFSNNNTGYQFRTNFFNKELPIELIVRQNGLVASTNNPTIDNMYNQLYDISLDGSKLNITASSHNVNGDYNTNANVERYLMFENITTKEDKLLTNIGSITNGPYKIKLKVDDGYDKTKAWYKTTIDLNNLEKGTYSIIVRTKTGNIDDYGELYDIISSDLNLSATVDGKKISITRNKLMRYRIEITVE